MNLEKLSAVFQNCKRFGKGRLVLKNARIVNVFTEEIIRGDIAIQDGIIAGIGSFHGKEERDLAGRYVCPGFIDSHIHIESAYVSPEEIGRLLVPHGGTTIIADPHEIVNVCGIRGLDYMMEAAKGRSLISSMYFHPVFRLLRLNMPARSSMLRRWKSRSRGTEFSDLGNS